MTKEKKIPMRQCVGCREMHPKSELVRVVKSKEGNIAIDMGTRLPGRGAYICQSVQCLTKAKKTRSIERAFSCAISDEVYQELARSISEARDEE